MNASRFAVLCAVIGAVCVASYKYYSSLSDIPNLSTKHHLDERRNKLVAAAPKGKAEDSTPVMAALQIHKRLMASDINSTGEFSDSEFLAQLTNDLHAHFDQKSPAINASKIAGYILSNLSKGTWTLDWDSLDSITYADNENVTIDKITITIKNGYTHIGFLLKRIHKEAHSLFNEDIILEMIRVGIWQYSNPSKGTSIEVVRLYPINNHGVTEEQITEIMKLTRESSAKLPKGK